MSDINAPGYNNGELLRAEFEAMLDVQVTPENINSYADVALNGLIGVIERATLAYQSEVITDDLHNDREYEDAALAYYGLDDVGNTLTHIDILAREIDELDARLSES